MRKLATLIIALLWGSVALFAQLTPYEYGHRWYASFQAGAVYLSSDYSFIFSDRGAPLKALSPAGNITVGYNITDAHEIRIMIGFGLCNSVCPTFEDGFTSDDGNAPLYEYSYKNVQLFVDHILNYNALAEYNIPFSPKTYVGVGAACSFGFSDPGHPEIWLYPVNFVPAFHFGALLQYDFPSGVGVYFDGGCALFTDRFNGQDMINFPLDLELVLQFGVVYHFPRTGKR